jgi:hypothetical protein
MFGLIKTETIPKTNLFSKLFHHKKYIRAEESEIFGMKSLFLTVSIPCNVDEKQLRKIKQQTLSVLSRYGVNTVFLHTDFPHPDWFTGYRRPDGHSFARRLVTTQTLFLSGESVFVYTRRIDSVVSSAIRQYCGRFRYVMVASPDPGVGEIAHRLSEASGASVIANPTDRRILTANCGAVYDNPHKLIHLSDDCTVVTAEPEYAKMTVGGKPAPSPALSLVDGTPLTVPAGFPRNDVISEAILRGAVKFENIRCDFP